MKKMTSAETRSAFLEFFEEMGHTQVASSSLVPANDPTLLFANAGMVQFKDVFLGTDKRNYDRATTSQKVMRVSGKHNDVEEVGRTRRHHTFFEMLGNFSFGDYFKSNAIRFAYDLLTKVYELPEDRLVYTVYEDDEEAYKIWTEEIGVDPKRVAKMGPSTNFWQMADVGPCGPTSEIHWDREPSDNTDDIIPLLKAEDDRFLEIWNLVFMQFNRTQPDPDHTGTYDKPLPAPGVDTGMGLERILSILQQGDSNYDTDLFEPIIARTQQLTGHTDEQRDANLVPYRVIADHIRAAVFLIGDGVLPGPKGRDSVCRLVIRRAARFGRKLGFTGPFLSDIADTVIEIMGGHYTDLIDKAAYIKQAITKEEILFGRTLDRGLIELDERLSALHADGQTQLPGKEAFFLKATLGLPIQVTKDIAEERGFTVDMDGFEAAQKQHALDSGAGEAMGTIGSVEVYSQLLGQLQQEATLPASGVRYQPYGPTQLSTRLVGIIQDGHTVKSAIVGDKVEVVLQETPFYVESGGQVSDTGLLEGEGWAVEVEEMSRPVAGLIVHRAEVVEGSPTVGDQTVARVDVKRRRNITRNHTGTHLLHAVLRNTLGNHVEQRGSLVAPDRLRFDFIHDARVTGDELRHIEDEVNNAILTNYTVRAEEKPYKQAVAEGAMALFGEKYSDEVRTVIIDDGEEKFSYELCGGVHVRETSEIGTFLIVSEGSSSAGIRRIEALTGSAALDYVQQQTATVQKLAGKLNTTPDNITGRVDALNAELTDARRELDELRREVARARFNSAVENLEDMGGVPGLVTQLEGIPMNVMREMADWFRNKVDSGVVVLGSVIDDKPQILVSVSDDLTAKGLHAGNIVRELANRVGGGGGGRPNMAQAGGKDADKLPAALDYAKQLIAEQYEG